VIDIRDSTEVSTTAKASFDGFGLFATRQTASRLSRGGYTDGLERSSPRPR